jgi:hypothetical protein
MLTRVVLCLLSVLRSQSHLRPPPIVVMSPPHSTRFLVMSPDPYNIFPHLFTGEEVWNEVELEYGQDSLRFNE